MNAYVGRKCAVLCCVTGGERPAFAYQLSHYFQTATLEVEGIAI